MSDRNATKLNEMYNPMEFLHEEKYYWTYLYKGKGNMLDQLIVSRTSHPYYTDSWLVIFLAILKV